MIFLRYIEDALQSAFGRARVRGPIVGGSCVPDGYDPRV